MKENINKKRNPQVREIVAKRIGMSHDTYSKGGKIIDKAKELEERGYSGAAKDLNLALNKSTNAGNNKLKELSEIEKIMSELEKNNDENLADLEYVLKHQNIGDALELTKQWRR